MRSIVRIVSFDIYYVIGRYLPVSYSPLSLGLSRPLRAALCRGFFRRCGKNVNVERGANMGFDVELGDYSGIGINARLISRGGIIIGKHVMMGPDVYITTQNHRHDDSSRTMDESGYEYAPVVIEDDVWIGARVIILPGVRIGTSSVVGAEAVVTKDVPPFSTAAGNPARVIGHRGTEPSSG